MRAPAHDVTGQAVSAENPAEMIPVAVHVSVVDDDDADDADDSVVAAADAAAVVGSMAAPPDTVQGKHRSCNMLKFYT